MFYSFKIKYFDPIFRNNAQATVILNLPQADPMDVKKNPFVIDLVNAPFMKAGIEALPNHCQALEDNIHVYGSTMPNTAKEIVCRFAEKITTGDYKSFTFKVYVDALSGYVWPFNNQLDFIYGDDFDEYEYLYQSGKYVLAPHLSIPFAGVDDGYYFQIGLTSTVEVVRITNASDPQRLKAEAIDYRGTVSPLVLSLINRSRLFPIRLTDGLLSVIGFSHQYGNIYGLKNVDYFEGMLSVSGNLRKQFFLRRDRVGYSLIVEDKLENLGCQLKKCFYLQELQQLLLQEYNAKIIFNNQELTNLCNYLNSVILGGRIIATLPEVMDNLSAQSNGQTLTTAQIVDHVAQYYKVSKTVAQHYLLVRYLYA